MEETISLRELFQILKKRIMLILAITLASVTASGVGSFFLLTPIYQASTQILVNQAKNEQTVYSPAEVQTNLQLINTYKEIIKSSVILELVKEELDLDTTVTQLKEKISVANETNSQLVNISVQDEEPQTAADIANTVAQVFKNEIPNIMSVDNVSVLAKAEVVDGQSPIKPQPLLNIAIALVVGLMAGVGFAFLLEYLDNTIKDEQDIEKILEMPVLGAITVISDSQLATGDKRNSRNTRVRGESVGS